MSDALDLQAEVDETPGDEKASASSIFFCYPSTLSMTCRRWPW